MPFSALNWQVTYIVRHAEGLVAYVIRRKLAVLATFFTAGHLFSFAKRCAFASVMAQELKSDQFFFTSVPADATAWPFTTYI